MNRKLTCAVTAILVGSAATGLAVAGDGAATKDQMERMVQALLDISKPLRPVDVADALAVALALFNRRLLAPTH